MQCCLPTLALLNIRGMFLGFIGKMQQELELEADGRGVPIYRLFYEVEVHILVLGHTGHQLLHNLSKSLHTRLQPCTLCWLLCVGMKQHRDANGLITGLAVSSIQTFEDWLGTSKIQAAIMQHTVEMTLPLLDCFK